mgnify:CR=1 FL=1
MGKKRRKRLGCPNCGTQLNEQMNYCHNCGQENHIKRATMKLLANDFFSSYFSVDSKLFRSLKYLLFNPSFLSLEYLNGKIEAYLRPIRLYIFISFTFFLLSSITSSSTPSDDLTIKKDGVEVNLDNEINDAIAAEDSIAAKQVKDAVTKTKNNPNSFNFFDDEEELSDFENGINQKLKKIFSDERELNIFLNYMRSKLPILLFLIIPVLAALLFIFFYKKNYYYIDHLVFAMHLQAFFFVLLIISETINLIFDIELMGFAVLILLVYGFIAARRFYKRKVFSTFLRLSFVGIFHTALSGILLVLFFLILINYYNL